MLNKTKFSLWLADEIDAARHEVGSGRLFDLDLLLRRISESPTAEELTRRVKTLVECGSRIRSGKVRRQVLKISDRIRAGFDQYRSNRDLADQLWSAPRCIPTRAKPMIRIEWLRPKSQADLDSVRASVSGSGKSLATHRMDPTDNHAIWEQRRALGYIGSARSRRRKRGKRLDASR